MKIQDIGDYSIHEPTSGGKAGKGRNKTASIQVRKDGFVVKNIRYILGGEARPDAIHQAKSWIMRQTFL